MPSLRSPAHPRCVRAVLASSLLAMSLLCALCGSALAAPSNVYVTGYNLGGDVAQFKISSGGRLTANGSLPSGGSDAWYAAMTPDAKYLYVTNNASNSVAQYAVKDKGKLSALSPAKVTTGKASDPIGIAVSPNGQYVYVANSATSTVSVFAVTSGGKLKPDGSPVSSNISRPYGLALSPNGKSLYVANDSPGNVAEFNVAVNGLLTPKPTPTVAAGPGANYVVLTPDGRHAYVTNHDDPTVIQYSVGSGGELRLIGSPVSVASSGDQLYSATVSPNGRSLYVPNDTTLYEFNIASTGLLTPKSTPAVAVGPGAENLWLTANGKNAYMTEYNSDKGAASNVVLFYVHNGLINHTAVATKGVTGAAVVMIAPDQGPVASFTVQKAPAGSATRFDGSGSKDVDGQVAHYDWSFGDGKSASGRKPSHKYKKAGTYKVTLTVTDDAGCSTSLVFTGVTPYCNGTKAAKLTRKVKIS
jgi:6-phosphogluconolactonase